MRRQLFPIRYKKVYELYHQMRENIWNESTVLSGIKKDVTYIKQLSEDELALLKIPVASFSTIDNIITENISRNYISYFTEPEFQLAFSIQNYIEGIHQICYGEFVKQYFEGTIEDEVVEVKTKWITKYVGLDPYTHLTCEEKAKLNVKSKPLHKKIAYELFIGTLLEGVDINSSFAIIFWFREQGLLPGFTTLNEYVEIDENSHYILDYTLYKTLSWKLSVKRAHQICHEWLTIIKRQYSPIKKLTLPGMNYKLLISHIKFTLNSMLVNLGYPKMYNNVYQLKYMSTRDVGIRSTRQFEAVSTEYNQPIFNAEDLELTF